MGNLDQMLFAVPSCINNAKVLNNLFLAKEKFNFKREKTESCSSVAKGHWASIFENETKGGED